MAPLDWDGAVAKVRTVLVSRKPQLQDPREEVLAKLRFAELVWDHVLPAKISHIYVEGQAYGASMRGARDIAANHFAVLSRGAQVSQAGIREVAASSARKLLTGNGRATKEDVWKALIAFGFPRALSTDETDALAILNSAMDELGGYTLSAIGYERDGGAGQDVGCGKRRKKHHPEG